MKHNTTSHTSSAFTHYITLTNTFYAILQTVTIVHTTDAFQLHTISHYYIFALFSLMTMNSLHESCQSAYRACHSTETALLKITNDLLCAMDGHNCILLVMLDLSAAFDTVSHSVLLTRMKEVYGVTEDALSWLQSYLADRSQSVIIDGVMSAPKPLTTGLPQGS